MKEKSEARVFNQELTKYEGISLSRRQGVNKLQNPVEMMFLRMIQSRRKNWNEDSIDV